MSNIVTGVTSAARVLDRTLARPQPDAGQSPLERARERVARAKATREAIDAFEQYGGTLAALVGLGVSLRR